MGYQSLRVPSFLSTWTPSSPSWWLPSCASYVSAVAGDSPLGKCTLNLPGSRSSWGQTCLGYIFKDKFLEESSLTPKSAFKQLPNFALFVPKPASQFSLHLPQNIYGKGVWRYARTGEVFTLLSANLVSFLWDEPCVSIVKAFCLPLPSLCISASVVTVINQNSW